MATTREVEVLPVPAGSGGCLRCAVETSDWASTDTAYQEVSFSPLTRQEFGQRTEELSPLPRCQLHHLPNAMRDGRRRTGNDFAVEMPHPARQPWQPIVFLGGMRAVGPEDVLH